MPGKTFYAYTRVSTVRQGEKGVSLQEQRAAIDRFARQHDLEIKSWFEERETAAKQGRPVFSQMLRLLNKRNADGVIIHKIDRSARNLKDWSDLGELIDQGVEVHFANESLDLTSRGGRLSADIQAVVAADYIRNLREETKKGMYGRLKQGLYPWAAPVGYVDTGQGGKVKEIDPVKGPLVQKVFELYASEKHNLHELAQIAYEMGLRNRRGNHIGVSGISNILNNPFYIGVIRLKKYRETYLGIHQPLVYKALFDRVQNILRSKSNTKVQKHPFIFRRLLKCERCKQTLIGELQKGHIYYRCHNRKCPPTCIREETVQAKALEEIKRLNMDEQETSFVLRLLKEYRENWLNERVIQRKALDLRLNDIITRLNRLTDAFLDGAIEKDVFNQRKQSLLLERRGIEEKIAEIDNQGQLLPDRIAEFLTLARGAYLSYKVGSPERKRELLVLTTSNREIGGKNLKIELNYPFSLVGNRLLSKKVPMTEAHLELWRKIFRKLVNWSMAHPGALFIGDTNIN